MPRGRPRREPSPLLRELRLWKRRAKQGRLAPRTKARAWLAAVAAARAAQDVEAPALAACLGAILRLGVETTLSRLEAAAEPDRRVADRAPGLTSLPSFLPRSKGGWDLPSAELARDLDAAAELGEDVSDVRARLAALLRSRLDGRLLAAEEAARSGREPDADLARSLLPALWRDLIEAEAQAAPDLAPLAGRLVDLQEELEKRPSGTGAPSPGFAPSWADGQAPLLPPGEAGRALARPGEASGYPAGAPGWLLVGIGLGSQGKGALAVPDAWPSSLPGVRPIGSAERESIPPTLAATLGFLEWQDATVFGFAAGLTAAQRGVGEYPTLEMPLAQTTTVQLDWVAGEPDPWEADDFPSVRASAASLAKQGARIQLVRGRPVPAEAYRASLARRPDEFVAAGPQGPVSLEELSVLAGAVPVVERPGYLRVVLAPASARPGPAVPAALAREQGLVAREVAAALAEPGGTSASPRLMLRRGQSLGAPGPGDAARAAGQRAGAAEPELVRLELDWVAGHDPWARLEVLDQAREAARALAGRGVRLELVRGREVPGELYSAEQGRRASEFTLAGSGGPVALGGLNLLDGAVPLGQRPGHLHVLLAPPAPPEGPLPRPAESAVVRPGSGPANPGDLLFAASASQAGPLERYAADLYPALGPAGPREGLGPQPGSSAAGVAPRSVAGALPLGLLPSSFGDAGGERPRSGPLAGREAAGLPGLAGRTELRPRSSSLLRGEGAGSSPLPLEEAGVAQRGGGMADYQPGVLSPARLADTSHAPLARGAAGLLGSLAGPGASARSPARPARIEVDWVAGQDPWRPGGPVEQARDAARALEAQGVRLEFVRGREVPAERYAAEEALPSAAFSVPGPLGPVGLARLSLVDRAVPVAQRPGLLRVLLAPQAGQPAAAGVAPTIASAFGPLPLVASRAAPEGAPELPAGVPPPAGPGVAPRGAETGWLARLASRLTGWVPQRPIAQPFLTGELAAGVAAWRPSPRRAAGFGAAHRMVRPADATRPSVTVGWRPLARATTGRHASGAMGGALTSASTPLEASAEEPAVATGAGLGSASAGGAGSGAHWLRFPTLHGMGARSVAAGSVAASSTPGGAEPGFAATLGMGRGPAGAPAQQPTGVPLSRAHQLGLSRTAGGREGAGSEPGPSGTLGVAQRSPLGPAGWAGAPESLALPMRRAVAGIGLAGGDAAALAASEAPAGGSHLRAGSWSGPPTTASSPAALGLASLAGLGPGEASAGGAVWAAAGGLGAASPAGSAAGLVAPGLGAEAEGAAASPGVRGFSTPTPRAAAGPSGTPSVAPAGPASAGGSPGAGGFGEWLAPERPAGLRLASGHPPRSQSPRTGSTATVLPTATSGAGSRAQPSAGAGYGDAPRPRLALAGLRAEVVPEPAAEPASALPVRRAEVVRADVERSSAQLPPRPGAGSAAGPASLSSADVNASRQANLDVLARQVYAIIRQRLAIERERTGGGRGFRPW